jgi:hypothetical protein
MKKTIEITMPEGWSDITLSKYLDLMKELENYKDNEDASTAVMLYKLCGIEPSLLSNVSKQSYNQLRAELTQFLEPKELPLQRFVWIDGVEYGFEPNLSNIAYGAYLDISKYDKITIDTNWPKIMAILYRPIVSKSGKLYEIKEYTGMEDDTIFLKTTMDINFGCIGFFLHLSKDLALYTLKSLKEGQEMNLLLQSIMERSGKDTPQ